MEAILIVKALEKDCSNLSRWHGACISFFQTRLEKISIVKAPNKIEAIPMSKLQTSLFKAISQADMKLQSQCQSSKQDRSNPNCQSSKQDWSNLHWQSSKQDWRNLDCQNSEQDRSNFDSQSSRQRLKQSLKTKAHSTKHQNKKTKKSTRFEALVEEVETQDCSCHLPFQFQKQTGLLDSVL